MLDQLEQQVRQLSLQDQLKLVARISERLSVMPLTIPGVEDKELLQQQGEQEVEELLALCDAAAELWEGTFDAAEEIRQMRQERDEQIWRSGS
jgi:hypothetical protein